MAGYTNWSWIGEDRAAFCETCGCLVLSSHHARHAQVHRESERADGNQEADTGGEQ